MEANARLADLGALDMTPDADLIRIPASDKTAVLAAVPGQWKLAEFATPTGRIQLLLAAAVEPALLQIAKGDLLAGLPWEQVAQEDQGLLAFAPAGRYAGFSDPARTAALLHAADPIIEHEDQPAPTAPPSYILDGVAALRLLPGAKISAHKMGGRSVAVLIVSGDQA
jgi:hypothetical protein